LIEGVGGWRGYSASTANGNVVRARKEVKQFRTWGGAGSFQSVTPFFLRLNKVMELLSTVSLPHRYISPASALYWSVFLGSKLALPPFSTSPNFSNGYLFVCC